MKRSGRLKQKPETIKRAKEWSSAVFALFGEHCYLHALKDPRTTVRAVHAAHIIKRSGMGSPIAYGPKDGAVEPRLGRPLCNHCHVRQETNLDPEYRFPLRDRREAAIVHNSYAVSKKPVPDE